MSELEDFKKELREMGTIVEAYLEQQLSATKQKLEAAEARIKASQEQADFEIIEQSFVALIDSLLPSFEYTGVALRVSAEDHGAIRSAISGARTGLQLLRNAAPVIPPDVTELQRENAELTRKLAEQQALYRKIVILFNLESKEEFMQERGFEELTKLLAEAKSKAVPECVVAGALYDFVGWLTTRRTEITMSDHHDAGIAVTTLVDFAKMRALKLDNPEIRFWNEMLVAAPQPETDIDQAQRFK